MTEINKELERIVREYKLTPSKLLFVEDAKQEEINTWFENIKEDLINYIHCSLQLKEKETLYSFELDLNKQRVNDEDIKKFKEALSKPSKVFFIDKDGNKIDF